MKPNEIKQIFDYSYWAFERVWECISQISDEQFLEGIDYSTGSIRNMVIHLMGGNRNWMSRLRDTDMPPRLVVGDFDSISAEQLDGKVEWELLSQGMKSTNSRWEILLHLANHGTDHRAQILALLHHHFHVKTIEQDMIYFLAEQNNSGQALSQN
jgi:uncharacterized damage-inducible protein DinB